MMQNWGGFEKFEKLNNSELVEIIGGRVEDIRINLKMLRVTKGVTQRDVARAVNVDVTAISLYESGKRVPSPDVMLNLADFFETSIDNIMRD